MEYNGLSINDSATIAMEAAAELKDSRCLAVKFDEDGKGVLCGKGENAIGILLADIDSTIEADGQMDVQVKDMGRWTAGAEIKPGDELACDADGKAAVAASGDFIVGVALTKAAAAGEIIKVQITKSGYKA